MGTNILGVGQSALAAAQVGIMTTGHNIANATTPGYSRQTVTQTASAPQNFGYGFVGQGTDVANIQRVYNQFIANQVLSSQTSKSETETHLAQINQINTLISDADSGLSASLQDFFTNVQAMNAKPADMAARQSAYTSMETLVGRFQDISNQIGSIGDNINTQLKTSVDSVNSYAQQIAKLNDVIASAENTTGNEPNDLLDQRDQLISDLNKLVKTTVVKQDGSNYSVFIGNGQPLVLGGKVTELTMTSLPTDPGRMQVGYVSGGKVVPLADSMLTGGSLGGLLNFRADSLEPTKNQLGLIATNFAFTMNQQNKLGQDLNGTLGTNLFSVDKPTIVSNGNNTSTNTITADITDASSLTSSDYKLSFDGTDYTLTRLSDGVSQKNNTLPLQMDGLSFKLKSAAPNAGDSFLIQPVLHGADTLKLTISDASKFALASPIITSAPTANIGSAKITAGTISSSYVASPLSSKVTFTFDKNAPNSFVVTPSQTVTVGQGASAVVYPAGTSVPYTQGEAISFNGLSFSISGAPADGDTFTVGPNTNGRADNRNGLALAALQSSGTMGGGNVSYQTAYSHIVNAIGNKTHELQVLGDAESKMLSNATDALQSESGVNLDEEAANLLRYQQAYQAAGKLMQTASQLFDVLLSLGQ